MKKKIHLLILPLVVVSGLVFANCEFKKETKSLSVADGKTRMMDERKKWEASPDGIKYKEWENSAEGKKVHASHDKIKKHISTFADMEAVVTSVTFQRENAKSSGPKWIIVKIDGDEYMMQFVPKDFDYFELKDQIRNYLEAEKFSVSINSWLEAGKKETERVRRIVFDCSITKKR